LKIKSNVKSALTLTLSRRERGLTAVTWRDTPTWDTESYSILNGPRIVSLSRGRGLG
jgi:hypothetical protein